MTEEAVEAIEIVEDLLGDQTAAVAVHSDAGTAASTIANGTDVSVAVDPSDGIEIDLAGGDGYVTAAQPLSDGEFRLAVTISDASAPHQLAYDLDVGDDVAVVARVDGGFDFIEASGEIIGGLAEPWGIDANGNAVEVVYQFDGNHLTRTVVATAETEYPVVANFCVFGKNPNGSCRGASLARRAATAVSAGWLTRAVCLTGAIGFGAPTGGLGAVAVIGLCGAAGFAVGGWASRYVR